MKQSDWAQLRNVLSELDTLEDWYDDASREKRIIHARENLRRILLAFELQDDGWYSRETKPLYRLASWFYTKKRNLISKFRKQFIVRKA